MDDSDIDETYYPDPREIDSAETEDEGEKEKKNRSSAKDKLAEKEDKGVKENEDQNHPLADNADMFSTEDTETEFEGFDKRSRKRVRNPKKNGPKM